MTKELDSSSRAHACNTNNSVRPTISVGMAHYLTIFLYLFVKFNTVFIYFSFVQVQDGEGEWRGGIIEFGIHDVYTVVYIILIVEALHVVDIYTVEYIAR